MRISSTCQIIIKELRKRQFLHFGACQVMFNFIRIISMIKLILKYFSQMQIIVTNTRKWRHRCAKRDAIATVITWRRVVAFFGTASRHLSDVTRLASSDSLLRHSSFVLRPSHTRNRKPRSRADSQQSRLRIKCWYRNDNSGGSFEKHRLVRICPTVNKLFCNRKLWNA